MLTTVAHFHEAVVPSCKVSMASVIGIADKFSMYFSVVGFLIFA